tara:strand:- start:17849 stop:18994 length:1146 start_codon:yes stop_codon:yes gene_type:complete
MVINPDSEKYLIKGIAENLNAENPMISIELSHKSLYKDFILAQNDYKFAIEFIVNTLKAQHNLLNSLSGIGHRVVHGGEKFTKSALIDNQVEQAISECIPLAPLHNPANLIGIKIAKKVFPNIPHIAAFDTSFHQTMDETAYLYPVPFEWYTKHQVRRYGFHGTSHRYISLKAAEFFNKPIDKLALISAHLGNGCSACAILNGKSVDTTMGLTPLEGLMMGTRSGDVDPSLPIYMNQKTNMGFEECINNLNKKSGLLGVSQLSMDMRTLESQAEKGHKQAMLAIDLYCYKLAKHISSLLVPLGKLDGLIFTGGIGENSVLIRQKTTNLLKAIGLKLDQNKNANLKRGNVGNISIPGSPKILVIPTNEELMIAKDTINIINN